MEEWKDIKGYEGFYQVSSFGNVRSLDRKIIRDDKQDFKNKVWTYKGQILKPFLGSKKWYPSYSLIKNNKHDTRQVHRLVAVAFLDNPQNKPCVNHKDGVKTNNNVVNLEWCTYKENTQHALKNGLTPQRPRQKTSDEQIIEIRKRYATGNFTELLLASEYGISFQAISRIVLNQTYKHLN